MDNEELRKLRIMAIIDKGTSGKVILRLLDEIGALQARIAELEAERRWIPCSERMPDKNGWYLVMIANEWYDVSSDYCAKIGGEVYWSDKSSITHWMPLPDPPTTAA